MTLPEIRAGLPVLAFADAAAFAAWLTAQPEDSPGLWLKLAKQGSGLAGITKAVSVDTALCHGWIDGQQQPYDDSCWLTRFTPRKRASKWSEKNRTRARELIAEGRVQPRGMAEIVAAQADGRWEAAYAPASTAQPPADFQAALDADPAAAAFFATLTGTTRYAFLYRIAAVKTAATRARKIADYVALLARGETLR